MASQNATEIQSLIQNHGSALELFARQWTPLASDCVQEAFIRLCLQDRPPDNVSAWLYRVVRNLAIDSGRSERARKNREKHFGQQKWFVDNDGADFKADEIQQALEKLAPEIREVVVARIWGELSFTEIASMISVATSTVTRRFQQGMRELKTCLERVHS